MGDFLQRELSVAIRSVLRDPRVTMVTVNEVRVARDLSVADVYVSSLATQTALVGPQPAPTSDDVVAALNHAAGFLRSEVSRVATLRSVPKLRFHYDETIERGMRMDRLIEAAVAADGSRADGGRADSGLADSGRADGNRRDGQ